MKIEKIDHVAILVKDAEKAIKLFSDLFEMKFDAIGKIKDMDAKSWIAASGVEIIQPVNTDGITARTLNTRGEGLSLLSLKVSNLSEAMSEMESRGIRQIAKMNDNGIKIALYHPKDTFGVMIELIEYETEHDIVTAAKNRKLVT